MPKPILYSAKWVEDKIIWAYGSIVKDIFINENHIMHFTEIFLEYSIPVTRQIELDMERFLTEYVMPTNSFPKIYQIKNRSK